MAIELYGTLYPRLFSETIPAQGPAFDIAHIESVARAHDEAGFDGVLLPHNAGWADNFLTAARAAGVTRNLNFLLAHRPGFVSPTLAARKLATLDHFTGGRLRLHVITGGRDAEQQRDGDFLGHDERYARTDEFLDIVRAVWTQDRPLDYEGRHYRVKGGFSELKPLQDGGIPISFGGASEPALQVAAKHADLYALWGETLDGTRELIGRVRALAAPLGRDPGFSISIRVIVGETEEQAWRQARDIAEQTREVGLWSDKSKVFGGHRPPTTAENEGSRRLLQLVEKGEVLDERLFMGVAAATNAPGNTTAIVGTAEQVSQALLAYYDAGVSNFLFRGFDPRTDATDYGRALLPLLREGAARRDASVTRRHTA
ncbi:LLM class flavin-dependent oxidoreductase [Xylophilus sp. GOD-11R]|uniref:LLM class flavin-dependent oxidoreductase n=1 Tax=Xylophilus sp. GOD-11R TaxID=3089814 RepID=UPI00298D0419|nr:LLM class flavin-dependent oxidoreductase [Xylophilus sp. GOD-11R]WPB56547.1 LLM class flavin-dependent oxidoreductase [Xylophilus sp. GOD-11R]